MDENDNGVRELIEELGRLQVQITKANKRLEHYDELTKLR